MAAPLPAPAPTVEEPVATPSSSAVVSVAGHNLRPKRTLRHVNALKQQAKRRKKNTAVAAGGSPRVQRTMSARSGPGATSAARRPAGGVNANGDVELAYRPTAKEVADGRKLATMKEVLATIPGFSLGKASSSGSSKKSANKKLSAAAAIQQVRDGILDLETQDSILGQVNLRLLLNKATFAKLPPLYQFKLLQLLPEVDTTVDPVTRAVYLSHSGLNNEFFSKSVQEWNAQLLGGERLPEAIARAKAEEEKERLKLDPWKMKHFEPIWGKNFAHSLNDDDESEEDTAAAEAASKEAEEAALAARRAADSRTARANKRAAATSVKQATAAEEEIEVTGSKKPRVDAAAPADVIDAGAAAAAQVAEVAAAVAAAAATTTEEEDQIDSEMATPSTDEIDLARRAQAEIEDSALTFVTATLAEKEKEEAAIDDEMMDNDDNNVRENQEEAVIEEPVIEDHILDEDGSVASTPATIIDDVMSLPTPTASPPPPIPTPTAAATPTIPSLPSSPALPRSPASSSVASVASIASTSSGQTQLPTMPTPQITATVLNAIPPPGSPAVSVAAVAIRYSTYSTLSKTRE